MSGSDVANWLCGIDGITDVVPIAVTIGKIVYQGARYVQRETPRLYLLGALPPSFQRSRRVAYRFDGREWYIGGYWQDPANPVFPMTPEDRAKYHPFGIFFMVFPWTADTPIDFGEPRPYRRIEGEIETL